MRVIVHSAHTEMCKYAQRPQDARESKGWTAPPEGTKTVTSKNQFCCGSARLLQAATPPQTDALFFASMLVCTAHSRCTRVYQ